MHQSSLIQIFIVCALKVFWRNTAQKYNMSDSRSIFRQTPNRTPFSHKSYMKRQGLIHQADREDYCNSYDQRQMHGQDLGVIYGTTVVTSKVLAKLQKFVLDFEITKMMDEQLVNQKPYRIQLNDIQHLQSQIFLVNGKHLKQFDKELYLQFIYFPAEMIFCFDSVIRDLYMKYFIEPETDQDTRNQLKEKKNLLMVQINSLDAEQKSLIRQLGPANIGRLVSLQGLVVRSSDIYPQMKRASFVCTNCLMQNPVDLQNARIREPQMCLNCQLKNTLQINHNNCLFTDKQYIKLQELPQSVGQGQAPTSATILAYDFNVDGFRPGDRVQVIGIFRACSTKVDKIKCKNRSIFNTYIDLISFKVLEQNKYRVDYKTLFTDQQKKTFMKMAEQPTIIDDLVKSFAPSIYGHEIVKKGILAQLFGGTKKNLGQINKGRFRADINICLLGDPSTAKSQFLQQVHKIAPRSIYTSGRGSSAVGLTANVRKDPQTGQFVLQSGALVLSDQGICCIDQFDKMKEQSRTILLQAMQQQTISIAKAGIVCQLNSRASILVAANPIDSKYNAKKSVVENINLPPSLLSRFDLIYIILDVPNQVTDKNLALHILDFYSNKPKRQINQGVYPLELITKFITYAKQYYKPCLTEQSGKKLIKQYLDMRALGNSRKSVSATPRQLESLIRMSEAFAKMRLSNEVSEDDVEQAVILMQKATLTAATDPNTGIIDLDIITTGRSNAIKKKISQLAFKIIQMLKANQSKYRSAIYIQKFIEEFNKNSGSSKSQYNREEFLQAFRKLQTEDIVSMFGQNKHNPQFKIHNMGHF